VRIRGKREGKGNRWREEKEKRRKSEDEREERRIGRKELGIFWFW
jgi:hypothetical protein